MKTLNITLSLLLIGQTVFAQVPKNEKSQTPPAAHKQSQGGVRDGGGKARIPMMTEVEARERLMEIIGATDKTDEIVDVKHARELTGAPFWMNVKDSFLDLDVSMSWADRVSAAKGAGLEISKDSNGRIVVQEVVQRARQALVDNLDDIKDPELKQLLFGLTRRVPVDVTYFKNYPKLGERISIGNGHPFDIKKYENLVFMVEDIVLDILLVDVRIQKEPCYELNDSEPKAAAVTEFKRFTPICFSSEEMSYVPSELFENQFRGLLMHEIAHQHGNHHNRGVNKQGAPDVVEKFQDYYIREVGTGRVLFRKSVRMLSETWQFLVNPQIKLNYADNVFWTYTRSPITVEEKIIGGEELQRNFTGPNDQVHRSLRVGFKERQNASDALYNVYRTWNEANLKTTSSIDHFNTTVNEMVRYFDKAIGAVPCRF